MKFLLINNIKVKFLHEKKKGYSVLYQSISW